MNWVSHMDQHRQGWQKNYRRYGVRWDGSCTTTTPQVTWLWQCSRYWQKNKLHSHCRHCIHQTSHPVTFALLGLKMGLQGQCLPTLKDTKCTATAWLHSVLKEAFYECFQICQTISASVHECACAHMHAGCTSNTLRLESTVLQILKYDNWIPGTFLRLPCLILRKNSHYFSEEH
jgi:hypothetical protein